RLATLGPSRSDPSSSHLPTFPSYRLDKPYVPTVPFGVPKQPDLQPGEATRRLFGEEKARRLWEETQKPPRAVPNPPLPRPGEVPRKLGDPPGPTRQPSTPGPNRQPWQPGPPPMPYVPGGSSPKRP